MPCQQLSKIPPKSQSGFTLIEIVVVVLLVGLFAGIASINILSYDNGDKLKDYTEDLFDQLQFAADQSLFTGEHIALVPALQDPANSTASQDQWELLWYRWRDDEWQKIEELTPIRPPEIAELSIEIDDKPLDFYLWLDRQTEGDGEDEEEEIVPALVFYGGGEALGATVILGLTPRASEGVTNFEDRYQHIDINSVGQVIWRERQAEKELTAQSGVQ
ncbi:pilus assembly FimT family protein [Sessilibacter sp. MAH4]